MPGGRASGSRGMGSWHRRQVVRHLVARVLPNIAVRALGRMQSSRTAIVLGASGSVGTGLVKQLIANRLWKVVTLVRRSQPEQVAMARDAGIEFHEVLLPEMGREQLENATAQAAGSQTGVVAAFSVLGIGAGTAKLSIDEHRAIDVHLNAAFARGLTKSKKVHHLAFMSAVGANPTAATSGSGAAGMARYSRVKGEAEEAVKASGLPVVSIFRPSMIIGSQHTPWLLERLLPIFSFITPGKFKSITVEQIAKAMIATSLNPPSASAVYHYPEMKALGS